MKPTIEAGFIGCLNATAGSLASTRRNHSVSFCTMSMVQPLWLYHLPVEFASWVCVNHLRNYCR